jgi:N-acetylgalactosamine-6-sulfatase
MALLGASCAGVPPSASRPNILVIVADDIGWGDLSCHGHPVHQTPHLDRMATHGVDFQQFTVLNPVCSPSRAAILTGLYPARLSIHEHFAKPQDNRARGMPDWLDPQAPNWIRLLHDAGYRTGHFGKWHLTNASVPKAPLPAAYGYDQAAVFNGGDGWPIADFRRTADETAEFIRNSQGQSFAANVWIHESHTPHKPSPAAMAKWAHLDERQQVYAAVMTDADNAVGKILQALRDAKVEDNTIVIFTSDNGQEDAGPPERKLMNDSDANIDGYGDYYSVGSAGPFKAGKRSLHEGGVRVPFIVSWPAQIQKAGKNQETVISAVDLLPSLCAAAGVKMPEGFQPDGENLLASFTGIERRRQGPLFWEWRGGHGGHNWPAHAVRDGRWKLLINEALHREELYDLEADPGESRNLAASHADQVARLKGLLREWRNSLPVRPDPRCQAQE